MSTQDEIAGRLRAAYTRTAGNSVGDPFVSQIAKEIAAVADRFDLAGEVSAHLDQAERVANAMVEGDVPAQDYKTLNTADLLRRDDVLAILDRHLASLPGYRGPDARGDDLVEHGYGNAIINVRAEVARLPTPAPARDAGEVIAAARKVVAAFDNGPGTVIPIPDLRAALSAYDAPDVRSVGSLAGDLTAAASALSDATAVRDAALEEAARVLHRQARAQEEIGQTAIADAWRTAGNTVSALRSSPPQPQVTEDDLAEVMDPRAVKAALPYARRVLAAYDLTRKPGD